MPLSISDDSLSVFAFLGPLHSIQRRDEVMEKGKKSRHEHFAASCLPFIVATSFLKLASLHHVNTTTHSRLSSMSAVIYTREELFSSASRMKHTKAVGCRWSRNFSRGEVVHAHNDNIAVGYFARPTWRSVFKLHATSRNNHILV
jgi:hypothetical protein